MDSKINNLLIFGEKITIKAILLLIFLTAVTSISGYLTGIIVLTALALATMTDILALFACYLGLRLSRKKASKDFQFGYYKTETFAAFIVATLTSILAVRVLLQSYERFFQPPLIKNPYIGFIALIITVIISLYLYKILEIAAHKTNSLALKTSAEDKKNDVIASAVVFFGILASWYSIPYFEGGISMFISLMILRHGLHSAKESLFFLLDYWDDPNLMLKIRNIIKENSKIVRHIKNIRLRRAGTFIFGEIYLEINPFVETQDLRVEIELLRKKIISLEPYIKEMIIYTLLPTPSHIKVGVAVKENNGLKSAVAKTFHETKKYLIADIKDKKIQKWQVIDFPFEITEHDKIIDFYIKQKLNVIIDNDMHSLCYCELIAKSYINIFPHFSNIQDAEGMIKILMINN